MKSRFLGEFAGEIKGHFDRAMFANQQNSAGCILEKKILLANLRWRLALTAVVLFSKQMRMVRELFRWRAERMKSAWKAVLQIRSEQINFLIYTSLQ